MPVEHWACRCLLLDSFTASLDPATGSSTSGHRHWLISSFYSLNEHQGECLYNSQFCFCVPAGAHWLPAHLCPHWHCCTHSAGLASPGTRVSANLARQQDQGQGVQYKKSSEPFEASISSKEVPGCLKCMLTMQQIPFSPGLQKISMRMSIVNTP